jgi:DNA-binding GntR family transcriptional regulator
MKFRHAYEKAAEKLRKQILKGVFNAGARLPSERELCDLLGMSRITVRLALDLLEEERLITRRHGSGTYVTDRPHRIIPLGIDYAGSIREHAPQMKRRLIEMEATVSDTIPWTSGYLLAGTDVMRAVRADHIGESAVAWDEAVVPLPFAKGLARKQFAEVDFVECWMNRVGFRVNQIRQAITAVVADARDLDLLHIPKGAAVLQTVEAYDNDAGICAGVFLSHYHPRHITLQTKLDWRDVDKG